MTDEPRPRWTEEEQVAAATYGICWTCGEPRFPLLLRVHGKIAGLGVTCKNGHDDGAPLPLTAAERELYDTAPAESGHRPVRQPGAAITGRGDAGQGQHDTNEGSPSPEPTLDPPFTYRVEPPTRIRCEWGEAAWTAADVAVTEWLEDQARAMRLVGELVRYGARPA